MTADEFRELIRVTSDPALLDPCLLEDSIPYVFDTNPAAWRSFRTEVAAALNVLETDIRVVGSGRLGFSLKPRNNLRAYRDDSDIDVLVVNASNFDRLWFGLLKAVYPRPPATTQTGTWLRERQKQVYTGWFSPEELTFDHRFFGEEARDPLAFRTLWFNTFKKAARLVPRRHEDIKTRLYRTWQHAELYHLNSLSALRKTLRD